MLQLAETIAIVPTIVLFVILMSQYWLLFMRRDRKYARQFKGPISILVPAHNEGKFIRETINALLEADYPSRKEIIVIDDGSTDETPKILREFASKGLIRKMRTNHVGKANALNAALKRARYGTVFVVDGDSIVEKQALKNLVRPFADSRVAAATGIIKVRNAQKPIAWFQRAEYLHSCLFKSLCDKINAAMFASGPLSAFRKKVLLEAGGFNPKVYLEDIDISLKIIKK
ncbi:MAG: glycosyltransferase family 2 protein, partial [Candidatus Aenigmarchaeota archaeon]|nr:glycosyltransferase family 2 protein [Candidatus Aenigmarchaeota archaeon]